MRLVKQKRKEKGTIDGWKCTIAETIAIAVRIYLYKAKGNIALVPGCFGYNCSNFLKPSCDINMAKSK